MFSNVPSVLSQCNTRLRLLHLLYDIEVMWQKTLLKTRFFFVLYSDKTWVSDQSERVQGPIYIIKSFKIVTKDS